MLNDIQRIGFVGLGAMGAGIARRLHEAGCSVTVWNRTADKARPLLDAGLEWAPTPRELAASADVVFTMLTDTRAVEATAAGDDGLLAGLRAGAIWADLSTIAPAASIALAERVREACAFFFDCPVSGSPATLAAGKLSVMAGG
ncbi:MAG: NAD(P)-binding domain-containing protein, partial [Actinomycetota bacterium]|nr:NAD(P)-binding domain-containing protein [Actinomycetota bacterium]